jgi:hypothetical protein
MTIAASAISGIINRAGFKKAATRTDSWSSGFSVEGFDRFVRVWFADKDGKVADEKLHEITTLINERPGKKYSAKVIEIGDNSAHVVEIGDNSAHVVEIVAYDDADPDQNAARKAHDMEKLAEKLPTAPTLRAVRQAILTYSSFEYQPNRASGFVVERDHNDNRLVRVSYCETPFATYGGDREALIDQTLASYARVIHQGGFEFKVVADEMSVLVGMPGEWDNRLEPETVGTLLRSGFPTYAAEHDNHAIRSYTKGNDSLRVEYYAPVGEDEQKTHDRMERYGRYLVGLGYEAVIDYRDEWSLIVKLPEETGEEETADDGDDPERVREALLVLREAVEDDSLLYTTRRAGPWSVFIMRGGRRLEIAYGNGEYRSRGYQGRGRTFRFTKVDTAFLTFIRCQLLG